MIKQTRVTYGRIALEAERARLARSGSVGGQVMAFEHMVERLAGGFLRTVDAVTLREVVTASLPEADLGELEPIKHLPGMTRACADSLMAWWMSGLDARNYRGIPRMEALFSLEREVERRMPAHMRKPPDIVSEACARVGFVPRVFGRLSFVGMTDLHPVWRPALMALATLDGYRFEWDGGPLPRPEWLSAFPEGMVEIVERPRENPALSAVTCADARHEALEAVRWAFDLLASGQKGEDIAIAAVSVGTYEGLVHSIARSSDVDIHIAHGVPALQTPEGQECAALADALLRGLSHKRVRRIADLAGATGAFEGLPEDWTRRIPQDASLLTAARWKMVLDRNDMADVKPILGPAIELLAAGPRGANAAGRAFLSEKAWRLWDRALRSGPAGALDQTLKGMRTSLGGTALDKVAFVSAGDLVAAPRKFVRLLGMTSRNWPRRDGDDPLIPAYVVPRHMLSPMSVAELDRRDLGSILATTREAVVFSWPRMDGDGRELRPSTLVPSAAVAKAVYLDRARKAVHAVSEGDRLFMRSLEFAGLRQAMRAKEASRDWSRPSITVHDGLVAPNHRRVAAVFRQVQSATSLSRMIRDPLGFVWKYALGFNAPEFEDEPLLVDARMFGNIVHGILKLALEKLNRKGGFKTCPEALVRIEVAKARATLGVRMEQSQPVPPTLVWVQTLDRAEAAAAAALLFDYGHMADMTSYAEIPFGGNREWLPEELPWTVDTDVFIPGTDIRVKGVIDRLDLSATSSASRVVDYKTGKTPANPAELGISGGRELQRSLYGFAVNTLLDGVDNVESALYYPLTGTYVPMVDLAGNMAQVTAAVVEARKVLLAGHALPGVGAAEEHNDMLFAFPARATSVYLEEKQAVIGAEFDGLRAIWETK